MSKGLLQAVQERILLCDGAMGTMLEQAGLAPGASGGAWNLDRPEVVLDIHRKYVEAGADCLLTNTFSSCRLMLEPRGESDRVVEIHSAAVRLAREAFGDRQGFVIGDIGPFGGMMEPYGDYTEEKVRSAIREQVDMLVEAGIDAIVFETQSVFEELQIGVEAAKAAGAECIITSMTFDMSIDRSEVRTMMGNTVEEAAQFMDGLGADILGVNCGSSVNVDWTARAVAEYRRVCDRPVMAQPNAGSPALVDMQVVYPYSAEDQAGGLPALLAAGATIVGGCCGTTPAHIRAFRAVIDARK